MNAPQSSTIRLSDVAGGRDNNLTLLRFLAATAVVYAHSFGMLNRTHSEPFFRLFGKGIGDFGVDIFFVVSGLLVTKSLLGKETLGAFGWARVLRIFPALILSNVLWIVVVGLFFSPLGASAFWRLRTTLTYLLSNSTMLPGAGAQIDLPFALDSSTTEFNVPLWTLPHELQMYALLVICAVFGVMRYRLVIACISASALLCFIANNMDWGAPIDLIRSRFIFFFFAGASAYLYREAIVLRASVTGILVCITIAIAALVQDQTIAQLSLAVVTPYITLWFAYALAGRVRSFNAMGDYSYGIYILAFPLQLVLRERLLLQQPLAHFAASMCLVLPLAAASWHLVESRMLRLRAPAFVERMWKLKSMDNRFTAAGAAAERSRTT